MEPQRARLEYLKAELATFTDLFDRDSKRHKNMYRRLRYLMFGLTAISAILAGAALAAPESHVWFDIALVVVAALLGLVTSLEGVHKPGELWIHERTTLHALRDLNRELVFRCSDDDAGDAVDECFSRLQAILGASGEKWQKQVGRLERAPAAAFVAPAEKASATREHA